MLATPWAKRAPRYDFVIVGSGYGGAITAARLANAKLNPKPSVCILERGREWEPGTFPESAADVLGATRSDLNPLGLYELLNHPDISVIKGSGLGGTSLINANVAIRPDREVFEQFGWPAAMTYDALTPFYDRACEVLAPAQHPRAAQLAKVKALEVRARELGTDVEALHIAVNFSIDGPNAQGVEQKPCIDCGNCVTGCNVRAKNTVYMNYLPMARNAGATILTQAKVEWIEKLAGGGWRLHGKHVEGLGDSSSFTLDAGEVVLSAGSLNTTEILLRSEAHGLSVAPALGTKFNGNGDFFGLAYNTDYETDVLGYLPGEHPGAGDSPAPGPNIVGLLRYSAGLPEAERIAFEDFSFPRAYVDAAKATFGLLRGVDTVTGNEDAQRERIARDLDLTGRRHDAGGAMNHSMLYLVMGQDDARGTILFEAPFTEPDGRIRISWDQAGQQQIFTRMNEEIRRHARALRGSFISNPTWSMFNLRHLITAHPLGGCPMGEDHWQGAVDRFGRVFAADGSVHPGLSVADGSVLPSALGVNPFLTISAVSECFAARRIEALQGNPYPEPVRAVSMAGLSALDAIAYNEDQLEALFRRSPTLPIDQLVNAGGTPAIDLAARTIRNDRCWKGFFPKGHVLNAMSSALFTGFEKEFRKEGGRYTGITSDTDGNIHARNSLEEVEVKHGDKGTLEAGRYILLRYLDAPWQGFYDTLKVINHDLIVGRVYLGEYPNGAHLITFAMSRLYGFDSMTVDDHEVLFNAGAAPAPAELDGAWRMDAISNANEAAGIAYLGFTNKPDGRFEARYQLMGLIEGLVLPKFLADHFQLNDFTPFHDEIRKVSADLMVGKYVTQIPAPVSALLGGRSLGLFHAEPDGKFGMYYLLTRATAGMPQSTLLRPFLDAQLPDGIGMTFDEEMEGSYHHTGAGDPAIQLYCKFDARMTIADVNEFVDGYQHEAGILGTITFGDFEGGGPAVFTIDGGASRFHYLRVDAATGEAEMNYHIEFVAANGKRYTLEGVKYMQKDSNDPGELLADYTTLFCTLTQETRELGKGVLKFRTFENLAAIGSLAQFLTSFQVTGTDDPVVQFQARMRFLAFTAQFVQREYDPLGWPGAMPAAGGH
ncbi:MAG: GMC family oxidoreductase [Acidobacteria bacterium]|nr:GMC family oxidoreductase [Acidobacteriota bacterium]